MLFTGKHKIFLLWLLNQTASDKRNEYKIGQKTKSERDEKTRMKF